jgi:hypothetical protein
VRVRSIVRHEALHLRILNESRRIRSHLRVEVAGTLRPARLVFISMVRDEDDILETWLRYHRDAAPGSGHLIIDHLSQSPARDILREFSSVQSNVVLLRYDHPGYFQAAVMLRAARAAARLWPGSVLVPLDADEFVSGGTCTQLSHIRDAGAVLRWRHAVPERPGAGVITPDSSLLISAHLSTWCKVAVRSDVPSLRRLWTQGNHSVSDALFRWHQEKLPTYEMLHVPFRGAEQLRRKVDVGNSAYGSMAKGKPLGRRAHERNAGGHWELLARDDKATRTAQEVVSAYGDSTFPEQWTSSSLSNFLTQGL